MIPSHKKIISPNLRLYPSTIDVFLSNYYTNGANFYIDSITDYLAKYPTAIRNVGEIITFLYKTPLVSTSCLKSDINAFVADYTIKYFRFEGGTSDSDFKEVSFTSSGQDIVALLSALPPLERLQSTAVMYDDRTIKEVLDDLLNVDTGNLLVTAIDGAYFPRVGVTVYDGANQSVDSNFTNTTDGTYAITLPTAKYRVALTLGYYSIDSITFTTDNNISDNTVVGNTINNVDLGYYRSEILARLHPTEAPILNSVLIGDGSGYIGSKTFSTIVTYSGVAYQYMISRSASFENEVWNDLASNNTFSYTYNFVNDNDQYIYIKLKNTTGESAIIATLIHFQNPITRSDTNATYGSIKECLEAITVQYGTKLTTDVTISCKSTFTEYSGYGFIATLSSFNKNSNYILTIDGDNKYTINCHSDGGIYIEKCDNIVIKNIVFTEVSSTARTGNPDQMFALKIKGFVDEYSKNIILHNITIDGTTIIGSNIYSGWYGLDVEYVENLTLSKINITNIGAICILLKSINVIALANVKINNCQVVRGVTSQPCFMNVTTSGLLSIKDCDFNCTGNDTILIASTVNYIYSERTIYRNASSEAFRVSHSMSTTLVYFDSCLIVDCLQGPIYDWTKYYLSLSNTTKLVIKNTTIRLIARSHTDYYSRFVVANIQNVELHNNIYDVYMPSFANNGSDAILFYIGNCQSLISNYNVYRDYKGSTSSYSNRMFYVSGTVNLITSDTAALVNLGYDVNSTFLNTTDSLFTDETFMILANAIKALAVDTNKVSELDITKKHNVTNNVGCYGQNIENPTGDFTFSGNNSFNATPITSAALATIYSNIYIMLVIDNINLNYVAKTTFKDDNNVETIHYGNAIYRYMLSNNDPTTDEYISDMYYDVTIDNLF